MALKMTKRTKKVGIVGKYDTRYGDSLRNQIKKMEVSQPCSEKESCRIWDCKVCGKVKAGGVYTLNIASAVTVRSTIWRLRSKL
ncbi:hypothetical protein AAG906_015919 [Vitis piasezkii]